MLLQKGRVSKTPSKSSKTGKTSAPTALPKTNSRRLSKLSSSLIQTADKLVIVVSSTQTRGEGEEEESKEEEEEDETVTYLIKSESVEKNISEDKCSSARRKSKSGIFMTQDEEMESTHITQATENIVLAGGAITEVKHQ